MRPFAYHRATSLRDAVEHGAAPGAAFLAGGTTMVDLMKIGVVAPATLVDITGLDELRRVSTGGATLRFGALAKMADVAEDATLKARYPALSESLWLAASPQLRNMATVGGNLLQRTRCYYFRDVTFARCNKRVPGSGCEALEGVNRMHAVLGTSERCVATMPSDWAVALAAFDATVEVTGPAGNRAIPFGDLHVAYGEDPAAETTLRRGEIITAITVPATEAGRRSRYLKVRDRESYAFATTSAAVGLALAPDGTVREARIALGGLAAKPWRARDAEAALVGQRLDEASAGRAAEAALRGARPLEHNAFKVDLGKRTVIEALLTAARREG